MQARIFAAFGTALVVSAISATTFGQAPPPPPASPTLWSFLGIPQASYKINAHLFNRRGNHPRLEKKPPLKGLADPANLKSDVPAIKAAAEVKQAEDLKPQKIKAIKYLATIGCGCYDKDEKITKALLAAMDDCTEDVRLAAINAVMDAASGGACANCGERCCCNEKLTAQLYKIAYELDDLGCPIEPSERVRQAAVQALGVCCPNRYPIEPQAIPIEGSDRPLPVEGNRPTPLENPAVPPPPPPSGSANENRAARVDPNHFLRDASLARPAVNQLPSSRRTARSQPIGHSAAQDQMSNQPPNQLPNPVGSISLFDTRRSMAHVHFQHNSFQPAVGSRLQVFVPGYSGSQLVGELEVLESFPGSANVYAVNGLDLNSLGQQAQVVATVR